MSNLSANLEPLPGLVQARMLLARAGERDALRWWDSEALSQGGDFVLGRLFPRSHARAAWRLAIEAARTRHAACPAGSIHLFNVGEPLESRLDAAVVPAFPVPPPPRTVDDLRALLSRAGFAADGEHPTLQIPPSGPLPLGTCSREDASDAVSLGRLIERLVSAYLLGQPGVPVLPYLVVA